ncbi:MAG: hypothetical protein JW963_04365 [Anaerolineales bacterium]|nr:hypothetical protein [Anaerolineales bacterium]
MYTNDKFNIDTITTATKAALRAIQAGHLPPKNMLHELCICKATEPAPADQSNQNVKDLLETAIQTLAGWNPTRAEIISRRFIQNKTAMNLAHHLNLSVDQVNRQQRAAIEELAQIIYEREAYIREQLAQNLFARFPPQSYSQLFGIDSEIEQLSRQLTSPDAPDVLAVVGLGGIGKTSLVDFVVRIIVTDFHFADILWLRINTSYHPKSKRQHIFGESELITDLSDHLLPSGIQAHERLALIRQKLKSSPHLILIDNLDDELNNPALLQRIIDLSTPSKFLLTSRVRPPRTQEIFLHTLNEIKLEHATTLMCHQATQIGLETMLPEIKAHADKIYGIIGGNPLALKLAIGLLDVLPLSSVLSDLTHSRPGDIEAMYHHIYSNAWDMLSQQAQSFLLRMPLAPPDGTTLEHIQTLSKLTDAEIHSAIEELFKRSLLEMRGTLDARRYGIHQLTETFLKTDIIQWPK